MADKILKARVKMKTDTTANWDKQSAFIPLKGEIIVYNDDGLSPRIKIGNGSTLLSELPFIGDRMILEDSVGKATQGIYINKDGEFQPMRYVLEQNVRSTSKLTDEQVVSAEKHYTPIADEQSKMVIKAIETEASNDIVNLISGINIEQDTKGHIVNVTADSITLPGFKNYVPSTRMINNHPLEQDIVLTASDVGAESSGTIQALIKELNYSDNDDGFVTSVTQTEGHISVDKATLPEATELVKGITTVGASNGAAAFKHTHSASDIVEGGTFSESLIPSIPTSKLEGTFPTSRLEGTISTEKLTGTISADKLTGTIPSSVLPSYVDDVLEYNNKASFPASGENGKIYIDKTTNKSYRWSGSVYVEISSSLALGETSSTAFQGNLGKIAYDHATTNETEYESGLYKITIDTEGHIIKADSVSGQDIINLDISEIDTGATDVTVTGEGNVITDASYDPLTRTITLVKGATHNNSENYTLPIATYNSLGGVKPAYSSTGTANFTTATTSNALSPTIQAKTTLADRYYAIESDKEGRLFVNVPWESFTGTTGPVYSVVSSSSNGLAPAFGLAASGIIDSSDNDWVLTSKNGNIGWYKLPTNAFENDVIQDTNYYHTSKSTTGLLIGTSNNSNLKDLFIPYADTSNYGVTKLHKESNCTTYSSDDGGTTPAAVKKAFGLFIKESANDGCFQVVYSDKGEEKTKDIKIQIPEYDMSGYLPLSGTSSGKPITGTVIIKNSNANFYLQNSEGKNTLKLQSSDGSIYSAGITIKSSGWAKILFSSDEVNVTSDTAKGLQGMIEYNNSSNTFLFRSIVPGQTDVLNNEKIYERYSLPSPDTNITSNQFYDIITTKTFNPNNYVLKTSLSQYMLKSEIDSLLQSYAKITDIPSLSNYITKSDLATNLNDYTKTSEILSIIPIATTQANGLISSDMVQKLKDISIGANKSNIETYKLQIEIPSFVVTDDTPTWMIVKEFESFTEEDIIYVDIDLSTATNAEEVESILEAYNLIDRIEVIDGGITLYFFHDTTNKEGQNITLILHRHIND